MRNKKKITIFLANVFIIAIAMSSLAATDEEYKDYRKTMLNDAMKYMDKKDKNSIIFSWEKDNGDSSVYKKVDKKSEGIEVKMPAYEENVEQKKPKESKVKVINTDYAFKIDKEGHRAIAYLDENTNVPIIATDGFYILKRADNRTMGLRYAKYYADPTGYLLTGWIEDGGKKYYLSDDNDTFGEVVTGNMTIEDGQVCRFDADGVFLGIK